MSDLYPTKTRLQLLADVAADNVWDGLTEEFEGHTWLVDPFTNEPPRKVTARVIELEHAGWVEQGPDGATWRLTDAGREVLEAAS